MRKYIFFKGSIRVEEGMYRPVLDKESRGTDRRKVIIMRLNSEPKVDQAKAQDDEQNDAAPKF